MLSATRRDTFGYLSPLAEDWTRRHRQSSPVILLPCRFSPKIDLKPASPSPPPYITPSPRAKSQNVHIRLRSDSGLALHTNQQAFRQYTDYNSDGSLRTTPSYRPLSFDGTSNVDTLSLGNGWSKDSREYDPHTRPLPDFFDRDVALRALYDPAVSSKLHSFAQGRRCFSDLQFLQKVPSLALGNLAARPGLLTEWCL